MSLCFPHVSNVCTRASPTTKHCDTKHTRGSHSPSVHNTMHLLTILINVQGPQIAVVTHSSMRPVLFAQALGLTAIVMFTVLELALGPGRVSPSPPPVLPERWQAVVCACNAALPGTISLVCCIFVLGQVPCSHPCISAGTCTWPAPLKPSAIDVIWGGGGGRPTSAGGRLWSRT